MRSRTWCFTWNNPPDNYEELIGDWNATFGAYQLERGLNGTAHVQGYLEFKTPTRLRSVRDKCPTAHWEPRRGSRAQAIAYCQKTRSRVASSKLLGLSTEPTNIIS